MVNSGSTGRITEEIGQVLMNDGHESYIAYGRGDRPSKSELIKIGTQKDVYLHGLKTALFDRHAFGSKKATKDFLNKIDKIQPDAIGLHNLHGYYLNIEELFHYLKGKSIPVIWTLFDCWAFTGHCAYFDDIGCPKWKTHCNNCPKTRYYPKSYLLDNSKKNYTDKRHLFNLPENLHLVVHSEWLKSLVKQSFLGDLPVHHIFNGVNLEKFQLTPASKGRERSIILGVANIWDRRKGFDDFIQLRNILPKKYTIVLIGLSDKQIKALPEGITGIKRTESVEELAECYRSAVAFVNPTYLDNFPTTNIEALACGAPVVTYNTGGSPEAIDGNTGRVVNKGDIEGLKKAILELSSLDQQEISENCRKRAVSHFNKNDRYRDYLNLYKSLLKNK